MIPLRVLLVDDEQLALDRLKVLFGDLDGVELVGVARNGEQAAERIAALRPDLVMLDIQMPGKSGLKVAGDLPSDERPEIVFVTAFEHFAPDAFDVEAADYLLKPVRLDRLRHAVERARRRRAMREAAERAWAAAGTPDPGHADAIWVQVRGGRVRLPIDQIDWVEAAKDYVMLHTPTRSYLHRISMAALEEQLDPAQLMRVHRSTFVRPARVSGVQRLGKGLIALEMQDGAVVQVGPSYVKSVLSAVGLSD
jgi:two-component system, LytTR family, response regulator